MRKSIEQLFQEFMYECEFAKRVRKETLRGYRQVFELLIKIVPNISLDTITEKTFIDFFKVLQQRKRVVGKGAIRIGIKTSTIATYHSKLNCFFGWLAAKRSIPSNPFDNIPYPTPRYLDKKFLTREEIEKILAAIHVRHNNTILVLKRNLVIFYLLLFCGLRREELLELQIRDIDFDRKTLSVRAETSKSGRSRIVPLHSTLLMHLKDYLAIRKHYTTQYLIVSFAIDAKLTLDGLKHLVQRLREYSGVQFHLHQFRHTFAVNFLKGSNDISKLKQLLGHRSLLMTLTYLRCLPVSELRGDVEQMNIDTFI